MKSCYALIDKETWEIDSIWIDDLDFYNITIPDGKGSPFSIECIDNFDKVKKEFSEKGKLLIKSGNELEEYASVIRCRKCNEIGFSFTGIHTIYD